MLLLVAALAGCTDDALTRLGQKGPPEDTGADVTPGETADSAPTDTAPVDTGAADSGTADTGSGDTGSGDTGSGDTGSGDTGSGDTSPPDTGTAPDPCAGASGSLGSGDHFDLAMDDFSGDEETTEPKTDANDGRDGDNPYFQRVNVARAHCSSSGCYWYTSSHQESGEPDPGGAQYVDYRPPFPTLGVGSYDIEATYRQSDNRASYPAVYEVHHRDGVTTIEQDQREGSEMETISLGTFWMCPDSYVRVEDTGSDSITMNAMDFYWRGT